MRNHKTRREETQAVKAALKKAGIVARVGHGTGTARGWLKIRPNFVPSEDENRRIIRIAIDVTGRTGEYDGRILVG